MWLCPQVSKKYAFKPNSKKFFLELSHWETFSTFPAAQKAMLLKVFYVSSTYIDFIKVVNHCFSFWSELECCPNCRARRWLSWTFILFLSLFFCCVSSVSQKTYFDITSIQFHLVFPWPEKDEARTLQWEICFLSVSLLLVALAMYWICICQFSSSVKDSVLYISYKSCHSLSLLHFGYAACVIS